MKLRPCIDLHDGKVKQVVGSTVSSAVVENYVAEHGAAHFARIYRSRGLAGGHVILLNSVSEEAYEADVRQALDALRAYPGGMQAGGGITPRSASRFLDAGASHVIVTSYVFREGRLDGERLSEMVREVGKDRLVLDLSCRRLPDGGYAVVTDRWQKFTELRISHETLDRLSSYCDEFLIHAADVEGKRSGVEKELVKLLGTWGREFPVTYAGGVHSAEDLELLAELSGGRLDVTVGSALDLFGGNLSLDTLENCIEKLK